MKGLILIALVLMNLCLLYGFADLNREMSATRSEAAQLRQELDAATTEQVKTWAQLEEMGEANQRLERDSSAVYSQVKELRWVVEGPQKGTP